MGKKMNPEKHKTTKELIVKTTIRGDTLQKFVNHCYQKDIPVNIFLRQAIQEKLNNDNK